MLTFFDFMYYLIFKWYENKSDGGSELGGSCAVAAFQTFNIFTIIWTYNYFFDGGELFLSKPFTLTLLILLMILNYIRYIAMSKFDKDSMAKKWETKTADFKKTFREYLTIYILVSLSLFIGFIVYAIRKRA